MMNNNFSISRVTSVDDTLLSQLNPLFDEGVIWDVEQGQQFLSNQDNALFVAQMGKELVGFLTAYRLQRFDTKQAEVLLYEVGVEEKYQRQGIGKKLLESVKAWAKEVGGSEVWVLTNKSNSAAMALYQAAGGYTESDDEQMWVFRV